jgi:acetyl esterase/lipase
MESTKAPLDAAIVDMERRWKESGIPDLYEGGNGPVSRERARNIRALLYPKPKLPAGKIERLEIDGPDGALHLRVIWPVTGAAQGTLIYFHGGGWVVGDVDSHEAHAIRIANRAELAVVSVEYRLAPEHPFPAAVEDAIASMKWASAHLSRLAGEGKPLAVGGDSAGGNLAAAMGWMCRDTGIGLKAQLLIYPATNLSGMGEGPVRAAYFGGRSSELSRDPRASPALADLTGVAPAIIGVGPHDFLYQDNLDYAHALEKAGVATQLRIFPTLNHGFFSYTAISTACEAAADSVCDDLKSLMRR